MNGFFCKLARYAGMAWDFIDERDIEKHVVAMVILGCTIYLTYFSVDYAWHSERDGSDVALIIGAVMAPWAVLQAAIASFYFQARK